MKIRIKVAVMGPKGPLMREDDLEVEDGLSLEKLLKQADKALSLKPKAFKPALRGAIRAVILLNGDRVEIKEAGSITLAQGDEVSLVSGLAGG